MVMVETTKKYICEICFAKYETRYKAEQCEKRGKLEPKFKVGDTVKVVGDGSYTADAAFMYASWGRDVKNGHD